MLIESHIFYELVLVCYILKTIFFDKKYSVNVLSSLLRSYQLKFYPKDKVE